MVRLRLLLKLSVTEKSTAFQFRYGSIKTNKPFFDRFCDVCFNSDMVRLRLAIVKPAFTVDGGFNSDMVRLRLSGTTTPTAC